MTNGPIPAGDDRLRPLPHTPALDGIRAVAVLVVLAFHGGVGAVGGGFLGVSTFFTLSGFLITSLLLVPIGEPGSSASTVLGTFWSRRVRRLAPAALVGIVLAIAVTVAVGTADARRSVRGDALGALVDLANWRFVTSGQSYGDRFVAPSALLHFWSLAVEEQFYLVVPLLVVVALRWRRPRRRLVVLVTELALLLAVSVWSSLHHAGEPDRLYYGTDTRAAELLAGCLLATIVAFAGGPAALGRSRRRRTAGAVLAAAALLASAAAWLLVAEGDAWLHPFGLLGYAAISCVLIAGCLVPGPHTRVLSCAALVWVGRRSYGIYVLHWPLFLLLDEGRVGLDGGALLTVRVGATLLAAAALFTLVEQPVRHQRPVRWLPRRRVGLAASVAAAVLIATAVLPEPAPSNLDFATVQAQFATELDRTGPPAPTGSPVADRAPAAPGPRSSWLVFVGDRAAAATAYAMIPLLDTNPGAHYGGSAVVPSCSLLADVPYRDGPGSPIGTTSCAEDVPTWRRAADAADADVVLAQVGLADIGEHDVGGRWATLGDPEVDRRMADALDRLIADLGHDGRVIVLATLPTDWSVLGRDRPWTIDEATYRERAERFDELVRGAAAAHTGAATVLDIDGWHRQHGGGARLRPDGIAVDPVQADRFSTFVLGELLAAGSARPEAGPGSDDGGAQAPGSVMRVLVVGDSTALPFAVGLHGRAGEHHDVEVASVARSNCGLARGGRRRDRGVEVDVAASCPDWEPIFADAVERFRPDVVLIVDALWELGDRVVPGDDRWRTIGDPVYDDYLGRELGHAVDALHRGGAPVAFVRYPRLDLSQFEAADHGRDDVDEDARLARYVALVDQLAAAREDTETIDLAGHAQTFPGGELDPELRPDGVHFTERAARDIVDTWLFEQLRAVVDR